MVQSVFGTILGVCWGAFLLVWGAGWIYNLLRGPQVRKRSGWPAVWIIGLVMVVLISRLVPLHLRNLFALPPFWTAPLWLKAVGAACLVLSTGLALWARFTLGTMWSNAPETKVGHQLRTQGPYGITRHPIYTAIIGMILGALLMIGLGYWALLGLAGVVVVLAKIPVEERMMAETFGEQYKEYQKHVPQLIPGLQSLKRGHL